MFNSMNEYNNNNKKKKTHPVVSTEILFLFFVFIQSSSKLINLPQSLIILLRQIYPDMNDFGFYIEL